MTDRELLELAAKAADIPHGADRIDCGLSLTNADGRHTSLPRWNPLEDDGDALRLAVMLRIRVHPLRDAVETTWTYADKLKCINIGNNEGLCDGDLCTATRRAIVRAATEIGRNMP